MIKSSIATRSPSEILREIAHLAVPLVLTQLGVTTMHFMDAAILGRLSVSDLTAGGLGRGVGFTCGMVGIGVAAALDPIASQAVGAKSPERAWAGFLSNMRAVLIVAVPTLLVAFAVAAALDSFGVEPGVAVRVKRYVLGQAPGIVLTFVFYSARNLLQAHGDTRSALAAMVVANILNLPVCALLVHGDALLRALGLPAIGLPTLGALGAGVAFSFACTVMVAMTALRTLHYRAPSDEVVPVRTMFRIGLPIGLQLVAEMGVFSLAGLLAARIGTNIAAAHQIAINYASITFMFALGVAGATSVLVGRSVGEGENPRRIGIIGTCCGVACMMVGAIVFLAVPERLASAFTVDGEVIALSTRLLAIAAAFQLFDGVQAVASGALRGAGDIRFPFVTCIVAYWAVAFPLATLFGLYLHGGAVGLWWGLTMGLVVAAAALSGRFWSLTSRPVKRL